MILPWTTALLKYPFLTQRQRVLDGEEIIKHPHSVRHVRENENIIIALKMSVSLQSPETFIFCVDEEGEVLVEAPDGAKTIRLLENTQLFRLSKYIVIVDYLHSHNHTSEITIFEPSKIPPLATLAVST